MPVPAGDAYLWVDICACAGDGSETAAARTASKPANPNLFMANILNQAKLPPGS
jgi:hypothetical protein